MSTNGVGVLNDYRDRLAGVEPSKILGSILFFSIAGTTEIVDGKRVQKPVRISEDDLSRIFEDEDLDKRFLPPRIKKVDAFRKATSAAGATYDVPFIITWSAACPKCGEMYDVPNPKNTYECANDQSPLTPVEKRVAQEGVTAELMVREVNTDNERVVRHIVKERRDRRAERLHYEEHIATLTFYRGTKRTRGTAQSGEKMQAKIMPSVTGEDRDQVEKMIDGAKSNYDDLANYLHADAIRAVVRNYLVYLNAISVKPNGGVYFVHSSRQKTVDALERMVERIGQGCSFQQVPLLDDVSGYQRQKLTDAFQAEVEDDVRLLNKNITELREKSKDKNSGKIDPKAFAEISARYQNIIERSEEYTRVLGLAQGRAASALELAMDNVADLATKVGH